MRRGLVLLALAIVCLLAGCTAWMGGSYASVTPHAEGYAQTEPVDTAVASSQSELISVLARLVKNHTDQASVDVSQYEGDLEKELDLAVLKVMETDPVVAYAAEDIRLQQTEVGVRQMVSVEITYSRTQEELQAIQTAWGENGIKSRVTAALERVEPAITLQVTNYQPVNLDLFVRTYYEDHLETIMECPQVVVQVYPEQGSERVVEIQFLYSASQETLLQMRQEVQVLLNSAGWLCLEYQELPTLPQTTTASDGGDRTARAGGNPGQPTGGGVYRSGGGIDGAGGDDDRVRP